MGSASGRRREAFATARLALGWLAVSLSIGPTASLAQSGTPAAEAMDGLTRLPAPGKPNVLVSDSAKATEPIASPLAGTAWRLQAIQSMDDAQGTTRVPEPDRFTLRFDAAGTAAFVLDCNRGTGTWKARAGGENSGSLRFGPMATTRALCPPPNLDERVVRDLPHVRGYLLRDGKLYLSLMADAAIYEWLPLKP